MSIFRNLFGKNKRQDENSIDIDALLASTDTHSTIIEIDNYVSKKCSYGDNLDQLTEPQRFFFFNQNLEREINNGGFSQFFFNSSGENAHETVKSLRAISAARTADILERAIGQFPESIIPNDISERREVLERIEETADKVWEHLDDEFFKYDDNLHELNLAYIMRNRSSF